MRISLAGYVVFQDAVINSQRPFVLCNVACFCIEGSGASFLANREPAQRVAETFDGNLVHDVRCVLHVGWDQVGQGYGFEHFFSKRALLCRPKPQKIRYTNKCINWASRYIYI